MNKHVICLLFDIAILFCYLVGCADTQSESIVNLDVNAFYQIENFVVDNETPLLDLLTVEYDLQELYTFFGKNISRADRVIAACNGIEIPSPVEWNNVNLQFPVECLRYNGNVFYSVYKVKNGGFFYVFWQVPLVDTQVWGEEWDNTKITAHTTMYIEELPSVFAFFTLKNGSSTAADVKALDPIMSLDLFSDSTKSYSRTKSGITVIVYYSMDKLENIEDLVVKQIKFVREDDRVFSDINAIYPKDLP